MNQRKAGAILSYIGFFINNIIGILYTPVMLRLMGQSEYGLYGTAGSLTSYLSLLSFGIGGAYLRYNARCRAEHDLEGEHRLNGSFLLIFSVLSALVLICGAGMIVFAEVLVEETFTTRELQRMQIIMALGITNMVITFLFNAVTMALQAYERYIFIRVVHLIAGICTPIANIIALYSGGRAVALSAVSLAISIICYVIYLIYALKVLHFRMTFRGIKFSFLKELFIFSSFLFLNSITDQITNATDNVILSAVSGTTAVAVYTVGANFRTYFMNFSTSISSVFAPRINAIVAAGDNDGELDHLFTRVGRIQFYVLSLILIGYVSIGQDFILIWAGKDYSQSFLIGLLLILAVFVPLFQNVGLEIQKAKNKHKARSIVYLIIALLNVMMTIPLSKYWGGIGAAFATGVFMNWYYAKHIHLDIRGFWMSIASILPGYILPCITGFIINRFWELDSYLDILLSAVLITAVFLISVWFFSMNPYEKELFSKPIRKLIKRN